MINFLFTLAAKKRKSIWIGYTQSNVVMDVLTMLTNWAPASMRGITPSVGAELSPTDCTGTSLKGTALNGFNMACHLARSGW